MQDLEREVRTCLAAKGVNLQKNLGQHFLIDSFILEAMVATADIDPEDHIVEIGAGLGILTRELLKCARTVTAIEYDHRMIPLLRSFVRDSPGTLAIVEANALQVPFPLDPYKIVANIPYHITSPLLRHAFLESSLPPKSLTLLMQREVAENICDTENAGMLTILVSLFGVPTLSNIVPPEAFLPPPKVESAILHIKSHPRPLADRETIDRIWSMAKSAFSQKRKMLRNSIGRFHEGMELLKTASVDPKRRPQTLTTQEWIALAKASLVE